MGNFYLTMEETAEEFHDEAQRYLSVDCPKSAAMWQRYGDNEGHVFGSINEILMAYETDQIHLHSRIAIPARALYNAATFLVNLPPFRAVFLFLSPDAKSAAIFRLQLTSGGELGI